jgi:hypothetical protein
MVGSEPHSFAGRILPGVKNAYFLAMPQEEYDYQLDSPATNETLKPVLPAAAQSWLKQRRHTRETLASLLTLITRTPRRFC